MKTLILKLNATGDVVRTTPLLHRLRGDVTWVTSSGNLDLLQGAAENLRCLSWENRPLALDSDYDLLINLEDDAEVAAFAGAVRHRHLFGAYLGASDRVQYTDSARQWFDLSLISQHGKEAADRLKYLNRRSYQDLIFQGLGYRFDGECYFLPNPVRTDLQGDVAIAPKAGAVWPMKNWAYYDELHRELEARGLTVNVLPQRSTLLEHLSDVSNHRCLVSGDSLPMHLALGTGTPCVTLFSCTSPWEIFDYGLQTKIVSPLLGEFFYKRGNDERATTAIRLDSVLAAVMDGLRKRDAASEDNSHDARL